MGYAIAVNKDNFEAEVVQNSFDKPVVVDFYATWCGPCQIIKPILEKLAVEYDFILAKIDIDQSPEIAKAFQVEGVPDVRIAHLGQMKPGFVGALPEPEIRQLLSQCGYQSSLELGLEQVEQAIALQNYSQAQKLLDSLLPVHPEHTGLKISQTLVLLATQDLPGASQILADLNPKEKQEHLRVEGIKTLLKLHHQAQSLDSEKFQSALDQALGGQYQSALASLLELVKLNRQYADDGARKAMVALFHLLGNHHPLTKTYQSELVTLLY